MGAFGSMVGIVWNVVTVSLRQAIWVTGAALLATALVTFRTVNDRAIAGARAEAGA